MNIRHYPGICLERTVQNLKYFQSWKPVCELILEPGTSTAQSRSVTDWTIKFCSKNINMAEYNFCSFKIKTSMYKANDAVYRMFEYSSCPICSTHMKRYLLSMWSVSLSNAFFNWVRCVSRRERFRPYIPLTACNNKCERENKFHIPASDVVLETCNSSPMAPVKVVLSQKSAKLHLIPYSVTTESNI